MAGFKLGELILVSQPYVYVLNNECRGVLCDYCFKRQYNLKRCRQCSFLYFCDKNCQVKAWPIHKTECKLIRSAKPENFTPTLRLLSLLFAKLKKCGEDEPFEEVYGRKVSFRSLMSHADEISADVKYYPEVVALVEAFVHYIGEANVPPPSDFLKIYGKYCVNSFNICDDDNQGIGRGLYLGASVFDHSCQPNAVVAFDGLNLCVRATKNMPHRDISKVYVSYIEELQLTKDRQNILKEQYFFDCNCDLCISPDDDKINKLKVSDDSAEEQLIKFNFEYERIKQMKQDRVGHSEIYAACVNELEAQEKVLDESHVCKVRILEFAFDACVESCKFDEALKIGKQLLKPYRSYYDLYHPTLGIHLLRLGKVEFCLNLPASIDTLRQAKNILKVTHGEAYPLFHDARHPDISRGLTAAFNSLAM